MSEKQRLVVIGNGMAGARTVEEILSRGGANTFEVTMIGDEPYGNYNRIQLSNVLNGSQNSHEIFLNPLTWYQENDITLYAGIKASSIDRHERTVVLADGQRVPYDRLIIATGSRPFLPKIAGMYSTEDSFKHGVFVFRTLDDCHKIAGYATKSKRAVVIGGGLLGLEAARGLLNFGVEVHVVHLMPHLMENQLDSQAGSILKGVMESMGVHVHLSKSTTEVLGSECVSGVHFKDGTSIDCDMVVISAGIRPNAEIASACGLTVEKAIVTDDQMRSIDDSDIYIVGECAQHRGEVYGLVAPLWEQACVLADHITGVNSNAMYAGSKIATKLKVMGVELASMGLVNGVADDEVVQYAEPRRGIYKKLVIRDGVLIGAILLGDLVRRRN